MSEEATGPRDPLALAAAALRQHTDDGWVRVRGQVVRSALAAVRPSSPVRGRHADGDFSVASDVVVSRLRRAVDALPDAAADRITVDTDDDDRPTAVRVAIVAAFGSDLLQVADAVRAAAAGELVALLGAASGPGGSGPTIDVDVHIGDVTDDRRRL